MNAVKYNYYSVIELCVYILKNVILFSCVLMLLQVVLDVIRRKVSLMVIKPKNNSSEG